MTTWIYNDKDDSPVHIISINELEQHELSENCKCGIIKSSALLNGEEQHLIIHKCKNDMDNITLKALHKDADC